MGYGLKRLLELAEEKRKRKEEKERIKKEKEEEKLRLKKIKHQKMLKKKQNKRAYTKRRNKELEERRKNGDEYAWFSVYVTKNRKKVRFIGSSWWKNDAYQIYNNAIEKNRERIRFPKTEMFSRKDKENIKLNYEILLVKKVQEGEETVAPIKNKEGRYVDNIISDLENHIIVDKDDWFVEEQFGVYGYHPYKQKKTYSFILNNLLFNKEDTGDEMRRIMVFRHRVIIQYLEDFDMISCKDNQQAKKLYDMLQDDVIKAKKKYIVFMGETVTEAASKWLDRLEDKTGQNRTSLLHKTRHG